MAEVLKITSEISLIARPDGILISGLTDQVNPTSLRVSDPAARALLRRIPSLLSEGVFERIESGLFASIEALAHLETEPHDPLEAIFPWSPYTLKIQSKGTLGFDDFKFIPRFYLGRRIVALNYIGVFGWRNKSLVRLPSAQTTALLICDLFNDLPIERKDKWTSLKALHDLQSLSGAKSDVQLSDYLGSENVVMPKSISLGVDDDGSHATAFPKIEGVPEDEIKKQFLNLSEVQGVYDLEIDSGRKRVLISPELQSVFRAVKKHGFGMYGKRREQFYRNPRSILPEDESYNPDLIDLVGFGPRVKGIGYPQFVRPVSNHQKENWFGRTEDEEIQEKAGGYQIECEFIDGEKQLLEFDSQERTEEFLSAMKAAMATGSGSFDWNGNSIPANEQLLRSCEYAFGLPSESENQERKDRNERKSLLIHTNEDSVEYKEETANRTEQWVVALPESLRIDLKAHQTSGLYWLQNLIHNDLAKGALLADEMGLGKTAQLLSLAAWCIESELKNEVGTDQGPYDPILIVAPLILVENWAKEIERFFDSSLFKPFEILHGSTLKAYRVDASVRELDAGRESLDLDRIKRNRLIITNYDTVKNYQYSFAKMTWSLVIIDEAQEIKEPSTSITHALKALNPLFRVASTGTPVETSLTNLWSIMDFVHPGNSLGSLSAFNKEFGGRVAADGAIGHELRSRLGYNLDNGLVKRRTKREVLRDLPEKHFVVLDCPIDANQRDLYLQIINSVKRSKNPQAAALQGLHQISVLAQHPFLIESNPFREDYREYLSASSKIRQLLSVLSDIREKKEKALVFTRSRAMQDILKVVLDEEFGLNVKIVNGSTASRHKYISNTRSGIIESFSNASGFQALILSPEVAGVGLTITAANHVIHYGRWWNPAKENQATDRAYRIGQNRPVYVYHLIEKDEKSEFETFDEKLHRLLKSREELADNFLMPSEVDGSIQEGLAGDIFGSVEPSGKSESSGVRTITLSTLSQITPFEFEALAACLLGPRFRRTILTPRARDGGVDVLGVGDKEIALIQCKHQVSQSEGNGEDAISELIDGLDFYRESVIPSKLRHLPVKLIVMMSSRADKPTRKRAKSASVELLDSAVVRKLIANSSVSMLDLKEVESKRASSLERVFD